MVSCFVFNFILLSGNGMGCGKAGGIFSYFLVGIHYTYEAFFSVSVSVSLVRGLTGVREGETSRSEWK